MFYIATRTLVPRSLKKEVAIGIGVAVVLSTVVTILAVYITNCKRKARAKQRDAETLSVEEGMPVCSNAVNDGASGGVAKPMANISISNETSPTKGPQPFTPAGSNKKTTKTLYTPSHYDAEPPSSIIRPAPPSLPQAYSLANLGSVAGLYRDLWLVGEGKGRSG